MKTKKIDYKWIVIAASFLMVFTVLGFCSSSRSLYVAAITEALSMPRSIFSMGDSIRFVTTAIINIFFGTLMARFGAKKLISAGFICLILFSVFYSIGDSVLYFYIGSVFLGLGLSWTTTTMVGAIVNNWCKEKKGTVMGFILAANGVGAAIAIQILSPIIYDSTTAFGYKNAYRLVTIILIIVAIVVVSLIKERPKNEQANTLTKNEKKKNDVSNWEGVDYNVAVKKTYFYGAVLCIFLTGMMLQGVTGISAPLMRDAGLNDAYVATVLSAHSIALTVCKFGVGFMYDHLGLKRTTNICFIAAIISMILMSYVTNTVSGQVIAMIFGILSSLALPLETVMLSIYANDLFGEKSFNKILGIFASVNTAGYAVGSPLYNVCYDVFGSYNAAFYISAALMVVVFIIMQYVIKSAHKQRMESL